MPTASTTLRNTPLLTAATELAACAAASVAAGTGRLHI
jgi:hypothetical protein